MKIKLNRLFLQVILSNVNSNFSYYLRFIPISMFHKKELITSSHTDIFTKTYMNGANKNTVTKVWNINDKMRQTFNPNKYIPDPGSNQSKFNPWIFNHSQETSKYY